MLDQRLVELYLVIKILSRYRNSLVQDFIYEHTNRSDTAKIYESHACCGSISRSDIFRHVAPAGSNISLQQIGWIFQPNRVSIGQQHIHTVIEQDRSRLKAGQPDVTLS